MKKKKIKNAYHVINPLLQKENFFFISKVFMKMQQLLNVTFARKNFNFKEIY